MLIYVVVVRARFVAVDGHNLELRQGKLLSTVNRTTSEQKTNTEKFTFDCKISVSPRCIYCVCVLPHWSISMFYCVAGVLRKQGSKTDLL